MSFVEYLPFKGSSQFYEVFQMRNCQEILLGKTSQRKKNFLLGIAPNPQIWSLFKRVLQNKVPLMTDIVKMKIKINFRD